MRLPVFFATWALVVLLVGAVFPGSIVFADATLTYRLGADDKSLTLSVRDGLVAVSGLGGERAMALHGGDPVALTLIDRDYHEYTELEPQALKVLAEKAKVHFAKIQKKADERVSQESLQIKLLYQQGKFMMPFSSMLTGQDQPELSYRPAGFGTRQVGAWRCKPVDVYEGYQRVGRWCVADPDQLGLSLTDAQALAAYYRTIAALGETGAFSMGFEPPPLAIEISDTPGVPILYQSFRGLGHKDQLHSVSFELLSDEHFLVPQRYQQTTIPSFGLE